MSKSAEVLVPFGFTALESEVYAFLLQESPASGYRIAQAIGKPAANTYKAIESLERKGVINISDEGTKMCTAIPARKVLDRLAKEFAQRQKAAIKVLESLGSPRSDTRVQNITSDELAGREAIRLVAGAKKSILLVAAAGNILALSDFLEEASANGVKVHLISDSLVMVTNAQVLVTEGNLNERIELSVDAECALIYSGGLGLLVEGHDLATALHEGISAKYGIVSVEHVLAEDGGRKQISKVLETLP